MNGQLSVTSRKRQADGPGIGAQGVKNNGRLIRPPCALIPGLVKSTISQAERTLANLERVEAFYYIWIPIRRYSGRTEELLLTKRTPATHIWEAMLTRAARLTINDLPI